MNDPRARPSEGKYNDGLDEAFARPTAPRLTAAQATVARTQRKPPTTVRREMKSAEEVAEEMRGSARPAGASRRINLASTPVVAAIVFGVLSLIASASMLPMLSRFADAASISTAIVIAVPVLLAVLFALVFFRGSVTGGWPATMGRGIAVALATWPTFSAVAASMWCGTGAFLSCFGGMLLVTGVVAGGPMLLAALIGGAVMAWLLRRNTFI
jgi:hypothetical protein